MKLTPRQWKVLEAIIEYKEEHQVAPTIRELCEMVGYTSTSTIHGHLKRLQAAGAIEWDPSKPRTIRVKNFEQKISPDKGDWCPIGVQIQRMDTKITL